MNIIDRLLFKSVQKKIFWNIFSPIIDVALYIDSIKKKTIKSTINWNKYNSLFSDLVVQNGPFQGMKYPDLRSVGSAIYPKLLGSYEKELHLTIEDLISKDYSKLIDIGCAEGYYAVGFAMRNKNLKVYAYDIDIQARHLCEKMATINGVTSRMFIKDRIDEFDLSSLEFIDKTLIICDIEGGEKKIFTENSIQNLKNVDLLIETHDFVDLEVSSYLCNLFEKTHTITVFQSVDDVQKVKYYKYPILNSLSLLEKKIVLSEHRTSTMEWLLLESKNS